MSQQVDFDTLFGQARSCCQQGRLADGIALARRALAVDPGQARAHVLIGMAQAQLGSASEALASFERAIACNPGSADAHGNHGDALAQLGRLTEAVASYRRALECDPRSTASWCNLAAAEIELGRHGDALGSYDRALALDPTLVEAQFSRAHVLAVLGRDREALDGYDTVLRIAPSHGHALAGRAAALTALGRRQEALSCLEQMLESDGADVDALSNRGYLLHALHRYEEALASLDRALALDSNHGGALSNRGVVLSDMGRHAEALASFERVLAISPSHAAAHGNRAKALVALSRNDDAVAAAAAAIEADPLHLEARYTRGLALTRLLRHAEAVADFDAVLARQPENPHALAQLVVCCLWVCDWGRVATLIPRLTAALAAGTAIASPHLLLQLPLGPEAVLDGTRRYVASEVPPVPRLEPVRVLRDGGRLRIAYLSGDFRTHPVAYLTAELFDGHDRNRFEIIGVSFGPDDRSAMRARLMRSFDRFYDVRTASDREVALLLRQLGIDIAVDLGGHTDHARPGILQFRPAPVQAHYLGYAGTMGVDFIDYVIADRVVLPFEQQPYYPERIVHLPDSFLVNDPKRTIATVTPTRARAGLPEQGVVFCCFNNSYKISADAFGVWMRLLAAVDGSVLWLSQSNARAIENMRTFARTAGVDPERIVWAQRLPSMAEHLARHRLADLFLDTPGYNAHTTASDALWAGLPVLTCLGTAFSGRVAASLLRAADLPELVTETMADYETLALSLAHDPARRNAVRQKLADNRFSCALFDSKRFQRHIEQAYLTMAQIQRRGEAPRSFAVAAIED